MCVYIETFSLLKKLYYFSFYFWEIGTENHCLK